MTQDGGPKAFRRHIRIESPLPGLVFGALEDTVHHVRVAVRFADGRISSVTGEPVRLPWSTCPEAANGLASLVGKELTTSLRELRDLYDASSHCTHFFDLAQLTVAQAASGRRGRSYEAVGKTTGRTTHASLHRDGDLALEWTIEDGTITHPADFAGVTLRQGFVRWCSQHLDDDDDAEAAFVLRRVASMAPGATQPLDEYAVAAECGVAVGACFTAQPARIQIALRNVGSGRDYSVDSRGMLEGFDEALSRACVA
jgi:hypothetical protein